MRVYFVSVFSTGGSPLVRRGRCVRSWLGSCRKTQTLNPVLFFLWTEIMAVYSVSFWTTKQLWTQWPIPTWSWDVGGLHASFGSYCFDWGLQDTSDRVTADQAGCDSGSSKTKPSFIVLTFQVRPEMLKSVYILLPGKLSNLLEIVFI